MIDGQHVFNLLEEQITAYNTILDRAKKSAKLRKKSVIIVRGGPGTGKSAIALDVIAALLSKGMTVYHATGSAAFTTTLRRVVGQRASPLFKYFNSFPTTRRTK
jgi:adenylylsulfate kinase-like enzyme